MMALSLLYIAPLIGLYWGFSPFMHCVSSGFQATFFGFKLVGYFGVVFVSLLSDVNVGSCLCK